MFPRTCFFAWVFAMLSMFSSSKAINPARKRQQTEPVSQFTWARITAYRPKVVCACFPHAVCMSWFFLVAQYGGLQHFRMCPLFLSFGLQCSMSDTLVSVYVQFLSHVQYELRDSWQVEPCICAYPVSLQHTPFWLQQTPFWTTLSMQLESEPPSSNMHLPV